MALGTGSVAAQPLSTETPTPIPTAAPTPTSSPLNHFQCYETHRKPINLAGVSLVDRLGSSTVTLKRNKRLCAPADKNGEDPTAPLDPEHLTYYTLKQTSPKFATVKGVVVVNEFGVFVMNLAKPDRFLVPTAKSFFVEPLPLTSSMDHFKCYKVGAAKFRQAGIEIEDQFGSVRVDIKKPLHLCLAADKNGEGIFDPYAALMCYKVALSPGTALNNQPTVRTLDQFGQDNYRIFGPRDLCVPSTVTFPP